MKVGSLHIYDVKSPIIFKAQPIKCVNQKKLISQETMFMCLNKLQTILEIEFI